LQTWEDPAGRADGGEKKNVGRKGEGGGRSNEAAPKRKKKGKRKKPHKKDREDPETAGVPGGNVVRT